MNKGDRVKILMEIEPYCTCYSYHFSCPVHGIVGYRQPPIQKETYGTIEGLRETTKFAPKTVVVLVDGVGGRPIQFDITTGMPLIPIYNYFGNIKSLRLADEHISIKYDKARLDDDKNNPCMPLTKIEHIKNDLYWINEESDAVYIGEWVSLRPTLNKVDTRSWWQKLYDWIWRD